MRLSPPILALSILSACSTSPTEEQGTTVPVQPVAETPIVWTGYYDGIRPRGKDSATTVQLWVRSDSTFIIRQRTGDDDTLATGAIGTWRVVQVAGASASGLLSIQYGGDPPDHYQRTDKGLVFVDVNGGVEVVQDRVLERLAGELQDEISRMKVSGTFSYMADAMSFQPCGSRFSWPCAGGEQWTDEGEVLGSLNTAELERHYLRSVKQGGDPWVIEVECSMAMGPAMEGDGADEYLFIHRVLAEIDACP
ncbi:MAG: hypothetical protein IPO05_11780 [Flavobacteriales bacterium]|nr:hypothetical protein [Flavobacteriales bacterium]